MSFPLWRRNLQPASFRGVGFHVEADAKASGRRLVPHEFPKKDTPYTEDMGRRVRRFRVAAYIIYSPNNPDYQQERDDLVDALEQEGAAELVHPTLGIDTVVVDTYSVTEHRERGGFAEFEIEFIEAGTQAYSTPTQDTNGQVTTQSGNAAQSFQNSPDISGSGAGNFNLQGPIGSGVGPSISGGFGLTGPVGR